MSVIRHAIYWLPEGELAAFGAAWLGWDPATGKETPRPEVAGLPRSLGAITEEPCRYGLHATLKPPFRLAPGRSEQELAQAVGALAQSLAPARAGGLRLDRIGRFLALVPEGDAPALARVAARTVEALDGFRATPSGEELARRRATRLDAVEEANLLRWGYPYVMDRFRFHATLTGPLLDGEEEPVRAALESRLPPLPPTFRLDAIAHLGQGEDGRFRLVHRYRLSG